MSVSEWDLHHPGAGSDTGYGWQSLRVSVKRLQNGSFMATVVGGHGDGQILPVNFSQNLPLDGYLSPAHNATYNDYDDSGALYYVVVVVFVFGFSIILMIGSLVRRTNKEDQSVSGYMKGMDTVRRLERKQEKFKTKLLMQHKKVHKILGQNRAIISDSTESRSPQKPDGPKSSISQEDEMRCEVKSRHDSESSLLSVTTIRGTESHESSLSPLLMPSSSDSFDPRDSRSSPVYMDFSVTHDVPEILFKSASFLPIKIPDPTLFCLESEVDAQVSPRASDDHRHILDCVGGSGSNNTSPILLHSGSQSPRLQPPSPLDTLHEVEEEPGSFHEAQPVT